MACPSGMTVNKVLAEPTYTLSPTLYTDVGVWDITMIGSITVPTVCPITGVANGFGVDKVYSDNFTFRVIINSDCLTPTVLTQPAFLDITVAVNGPAVPNDLTVRDSKGILHNEIRWCGKRVYNFTGLPSFCTQTSVTYAGYPDGISC